MKNVNYLAGAALLLIFALALANIQRESLWFDEAWTAYAVRNPPPTTFEPPRGERAILSTPFIQAWDSTRTTFERVRTDVHPPLYFITLDAWVFAAGESVFALRYLSLLLALMGAATVYTLGCVLFGGVTGVYALVIYGTAMLFIHYSQEARMYTLLMTLAAASTLALARLLRRPTLARGGLYAVLAALGLYTHYAMALVLLTHGLYALLPPRRLLMWVAGTAGAGVLFAPYLPIVLAQWQRNPDGALAAPIPTNVAAVSGLWLLLTGGWWWVGVLALAAVGWGAWRDRGQWRAWTLVLLWLIVTPAVLLTANAALMPLYQVRYALAALPAWALLVGAGLAALNHHRYGAYAAPLLAALVVAAQLNSLETMLPPKPPYRETIAAVIAERDPLEPIITDLAQRDPAHYHSRELGLTDGLALDLAWRGHTADEVRADVGRMADAQTVWLAMPVNVAKTWHTAAALVAQGRTVTYAVNVENVVLYRFEQDDTPSEFSFAFGAGDAPVATFAGEIGADVRTTHGETVCVDIALDAAQPEANALSLTLVRNYDDIIAQWNGALTDDQACFDTPSEPGEYHVYMTVYDVATAQRHPVMQRETLWGWWVVSHRVLVE